MDVSKISCGIAGEYYVAAEMARRGWITTLTRGNTEAFDILAASPDGSIRLAIQVKTNQRGRRQWPLTEKAERYAESGLWYVFVAMPEQTSESPEYHVVHARTVAEFVRRNNEEYLQTPGRHGRMRKGSSLRMFWDYENKWRGRWDDLRLIEAGAEQLGSEPSAA